MKTKNILYLNSNNHNSYKYYPIKNNDFPIAQEEQMTEVSSHTHLILHQPQLSS